MPLKLSVIQLKKVIDAHKHIVRSAINAPHLLKNLCALISNTEILLSFKWFDYCNSFIFFFLWLVEVMMPFVLLNVFFVFSLTIC